jgi:signal transduction histidine kinase/ligand-binding sensor domain-containing protein
MKCSTGRPLGGNVGGRDSDWAICLIVVVLLAIPCASWGASPDSASSQTESPSSTGLHVGPSGPNLRFDRLSVDQGLSQSTVNCILQDSYGFMWFGTSDGLNKYDGYDVIVYRHDPDDPYSLSHDRVWSLFEDSTGVLWVGTYGGGLNRFDRDAGQFTRYDADDFQNVTDEPEEFRNVVSAIGEQPAGVLWIATYGGGLVRLDLETETFTSYAPDPADARFGGHEWITALLIDQSGMLWIGTHSEGLDRFDPSTGQITTYRHDPQDPDSLGFDWITEIAQDRSGTIWIGTRGRGLDRFDADTGTFDHYRHTPEDPASLGGDEVRSILEDPVGVLWIGTYGGGLDAFDPDSGTFAHYRHDPTDLRSLSSDRIQSIYQSRAGLLWVGTRGGGVNRSDPASGRFTHSRGDSDDLLRAGDYQVLALHEDEYGVLWIGTAGSGLDALDRETGAWRHYRHNPADPGSLGNDTVWAIHEDASGTFWLGTTDGVYRFDRQAERFDRLPHDPPDPADVKTETVYAIAEDRQGTLWLGTRGRGLSGFDPATGTFTFHQYRGDPNPRAQEKWTIGSNYIHDIVEDASGRIWIGSEDGLNLYEREARRWRWYQHDPADPHSLSHNWVLSLYPDRAGILWIGTQGGGLNRLDPATGTFSSYRTRDGLANDTVLGILAGEDGALWLATANGLSRFDPDTETFKTYGAGDGLPIGEFSTAYRSDSGELFFAGTDGFLSFFPHQIEDNTYVPPVVLTSLQQNGMAVETDQAPEDLKAVSFRWPDNAFEFGFAALNYTLPGKNQHAYMLEGFDSDWNYSGNRRFGRYTNLPGGTYTLRIKGSNNDELWNEEGTSIQITIVPPFWQTWWFWGIVALALAGGAFGGYRLRVRSLEARGRELEAEVQARTADLQREVEGRIQAEKALRQRERDQAVAEERNRLARDLHDSVTQALYGVTLYSEAAAGHLDLGHTDRAVEHLEELQNTAQEALAEMRLLIFELRPPILEELGLVAALQTRLQAVEGRAGLKTEFTTNLQDPLPPDLEEGLYRLAQEALNNVLKHAQAEQIRVHLRQEGGCVTLEIADDGVGFDPATASERGGMGLAAIAERAADLGARLAVDSQVGRGTKVTVVWGAGDGPGTTGGGP